MKTLNERYFMKNEKYTSQYLTVRELELNKSLGRKYVTHVHYTGWPDFGVPSDDTINDFELMLGYANERLADIHERNLD